MPLYEYRCLKCGKTLEALRKFSDVPLTVHEECGGELERLLSAPAFHLKGSGWYATDYAKGSTSKPSEAKSEDKSEGKTESKSESKTETSTDTKTESKPKSAEAKTESKPATPATKTD